MRLSTFRKPCDNANTSSLINESQEMMIPEGFGWVIVWFQNKELLISDPEKCRVVAKLGEEETEIGVAEFIYQK